jgi:signal transduction histidine kinase
MSPSVHLLLHNIGSVLSGIIALSLAIFSIVNNPKKNINITLALINVAVAIFCFSHVIGTNISNPNLSKTVLMFNLSVIFIVVFVMHVVFEIIHKERAKMGMLIFIYATGIFSTLFFVFVPNSFLLPSIPIMYFTNYYNAGEFHWAMRLIFQAILPIYLLYEMTSALNKETDPNEQNRIKYFMATVAIGYALGVLPVLPIFGINTDPIWGMLFVPFYTIPLVYGIVQYNLVDIKIIARKAFLYGVAIASITGLIILFNFTNQLLQNTYPSFPSWLVPLVSSIFAVIVGVFVWRQMRQGELLKYEFITVVTHKFRTPLTHIKWATENLTKIATSFETQEQLQYIQNANGKLVELTNLLMNVSETENKSFDYKLEKADLTTLAQEVINSLKSQTNDKDINIVTNFMTGSFANIDIPRIKFVIQVFIENAIRYTPSKGIIRVIVTKNNNKTITLSVTDSGIGIPKEEIPLLFSKFYRGKQAKLTDTEGMGIGLFMSKEVIKKFRGKIWAESNGLNQGSKFSFTIPSL